jgi:hypothetical protein
LPDSCLTRKRRGNKGDFFGGVKGVKEVKGVKGVKGVKTNAFVDMKLNISSIARGQARAEGPSA